MSSKERLHVKLKLSTLKTRLHANQLHKSNEKQKQESVDNCKVHVPLFYLDHQRCDHANNLMSWSLIRHSLEQSCEEARHGGNVLR